jgi:predicted phosphoribosyltransferase
MEVVFASWEIKKYQDSNTVVLTYLEAACPLVTKLQKRLHSFRYYTLKKITLSTEFAIGAVSLASTIVDEQPDIPKKNTSKPIWENCCVKKYKLYRKRKPIAVDGKNVIIVDDGIATGNTLTLSIAMLRKKSCKNNSCGSVYPTTA